MTVAEVTHRKIIHNLVGRPRLRRHCVLVYSWGGRLDPILLALLAVFSLIIP